MTTIRIDEDVKEEFNRLMEEYVFSSIKKPNKEIFKTLTSKTMGISQNDFLVILMSKYKEL